MWILSVNKILYLPVEQDIGLSILHHGLMDLCHILIIELIPLTVDHILTVSYIVPTCVGKEQQRKSDKTSQRYLHMHAQPHINVEPK